MINNNTVAEKSAVPTLPETTTSDVPTTTPPTSPPPAENSLQTAANDNEKVNDRDAKLEAFQEKQKLIEEQNRRKKEMLSKVGQHS